MNVDNILEDERKEYMVLKAVYELSNPQAMNGGVSEQTIASHTGLSLSETKDILTRLVMIYRLISCPFLDGGYVSNSVTKSKLLEYARLTNQSSKQVINNFHGSVGAVQNGDHNTANVNQTIGSTHQEILQAITELRQQIITSTLPPNLQEVADEALDTLLEEIVSPTSKPAKIKAAWMNICTVIGKAKDPIVLINAAFSLQEHLSKLNIDLSDFHLPHF